MKNFLTFKEAADYLGIPEQEFQNIVDKKEIPSYKIGGVYVRFKTDELNLYRRKALKGPEYKNSNSTLDTIKDFFYFNDFYIYSGIAMLVILYFILR